MPGDEIDGEGNAGKAGDLECPPAARPMAERGGRWLMHPDGEDGQRQGHAIEAGHGRPDFRQFDEDAGERNHDRAQDQDGQGETVGGGAQFHGIIRILAAGVG